MFRSAKYLILFLALVPTLWLAGVGWGEETSLENAAESAWKNAWEHFYSPETRLFYDFLESLTPGETL